MTEVVGILVALAALLLGLLAIGWAYGEFSQKPPAGSGK